MIVEKRGGPRGHGRSGKGERCQSDCRKVSGPAAESSSTGIVVLSEYSFGFFGPHSSEVPSYGDANPTWHLPKELNGGAQALARGWAKVMRVASRYMNQPSVCVVCSASFIFRNG